MIVSNAELTYLGARRGERLYNSCLAVERINLIQTQSNLFPERFN